MSTAAMAYIAAQTAMLPRGPSAPQPHSVWRAACARQPMLRTHILCWEVQVLPLGCTPSGSCTPNYSLSMQPMQQQPMRTCPPLSHAAPHSGAP